MLDKARATLKKCTKDIPIPESEAKKIQLIQTVSIVFVYLLILVSMLE